MYYIYIERERERERGEKEKVFLVAAGEYPENHAWRQCSWDSFHILPWDRVPKHYQTQVQLLAARKSVPKGQVLVERKVAFNPKAINLGRRWTQCPQNHLQRFCSAMKVFKGKKGSNFSESLRREVRSVVIPRCMQACQLLVIFLHILSCSHTLFARLLKGKLGKRSGHLLITCSLFLLWSTERNKRLGKVLCAWARGE